MMNPFLDIAIRSLSVYIFMVIGIRIFGKTQLSQLNSGDIVLLLLISNAVQNAMVGSNVSLEGGIFAALVLFVANYILKKFLFKNKTIKDLLESEPLVLIKDGYIEEDNIKKADIDLSELKESVREHGVDKISKVQLAMLEVDGNISIVSYDQSENQTKYSRHRIKRILKHKL